MNARACFKTFMSVQFLYDIVPPVMARATSDSSSNNDLGPKETVESVI